MNTTKHMMTARDFFDYLLGNEQTQDLAVQLAHVYHQRESRSTRIVTGR
jgi:hypothetical protein